MRVKQYKIQVAVFFVFLFGNLFSQQESDKSQLFLIHEDKVLPYMAEKYEDALKSFKKVITESNVDMNYGVSQTEYFTYSSIMKVDDFDGLSKHFAMTKEAINKIGAEKFSSVMKQFDGCYDSHKSYLLRLRNDLSYKAKYGLDEKEDLNFRHFDFFHFIPGKEEEMINLLKDMKEMNEKNNIEEGYRIYQGDIGTDSPMILLVKPFKDRVDWVTKSEEISKKLGDELKDLRKKMISIMQKFEHKNGMIRPDLAVTK